MKKSRLLPKIKQTTVQITDLRMNGLRYKSFQEGDFYASITLDKVLANAGILELDNSELERMLKKKDLKEEALVAK